MAYDWGKLVDTVYQSTLRRTPQGVNRDYWSRHLQNVYDQSVGQGMSEGQAYGAASQNLLNSIMLSPEWQDTGNTADLSALNAEIATLTNENVSLTDQVNNPYSDEDWDNLLNRSYQSAFNRDVGQQGKTYWGPQVKDQYQQLVDKGWSKDAAFGLASQWLYKGLSAGSEYIDENPNSIQAQYQTLQTDYANLQNTTNQPASYNWRDLVNRTYQSTLNRDAAQEGYDYWTPAVQSQYQSYLDAGASENQAYSGASQWLLKGVMASEEYTEDNWNPNWDWNSLINSTYQTFFDRPAGQEGLDYWGPDLADYYQTKITGGATPQDAYGLTNQWFLQGLQHSPEWQGIYGPTVNQSDTTNYVGGSGGGGTQVIQATPQASKTAADQSVEPALDISTASVGSGVQRKKYNVGGGSSSLNIPNPSGGGLGIS